jgi:hypothetical protein
MRRSTVLSLADQIRRISTHSFHENKKDHPAQTYPLKLDIYDVHSYNFINNIFVNINIIDI